MVIASAAVFQIYGTLGFRFLFRSSVTAQNIPDAEAAINDMALSKNDLYLHYAQIYLLKLDSLAAKDAASLR